MAGWVDQGGEGFGQVCEGLGCCFGIARKGRPVRGVGVIGRGQVDR